MVVLLPLKRYVRTMTDFAKLMDMLLDRARSAGADAADGIVVGGHGHSVSVRLGEVEAIERSEDHDIGLRVFVDGRNASISTSRLDEDSISSLAERAVAMAKLAPQDPFAMLAAPELLAKDWPELDMFDATTPSADDFKTRRLDRRRCGAICRRHHQFRRRQCLPWVSCHDDGHQQWVFRVLSAQQFWHLRHGLV